MLQIIKRERVRGGDEERERYIERGNLKTVAG